MNPNTKSKILQLLTLSAIATSILFHQFAWADNVVYNSANQGASGLIPVTATALKIQPRFPVTVAGTNIITRRPVSATFVNGSVTVSNLSAGVYTNTIVDPTATTTFLIEVAESGTGNTVNAHEIITFTTNNPISSQFVRAANGNATGLTSSTTTLLGNVTIGGVTRTTWPEGGEGSGDSTNGLNAVVQTHIAAQILTNDALRNYSTNASNVLSAAIDTSRGNKVYVRTNGLANGTRGNERLATRSLTNAIDIAIAGDEIIVQSGRYHIPTNTVSLLKNGVDWDFGDAIITTGVGNGSDVSDYRFLFTDAAFDTLESAGAITSNIRGRAEFYVSNYLGSVLYQIDPNTKVTFEGRVARTLGNISAIWQAGGGLKLFGLDIQSDSYDGYLNEANIDGTNYSKIYMDVPRIAGGNSIIELGLPFQEWGDCVINVGVGELLAGGGQVGTFNLADKAIVNMATMKFNRGGFIYGAVSGTATGSGILQNCRIEAYHSQTVPMVQSPGVFALRTMGTFKNCTFVGPTNCDPFSVTNGTGSLTLENCTIIAGIGATNSIAAPNAQTVKVIGGLNINKKISSNITLASGNGTNHFVNFDSRGFFKHIGSATFTGTIFGNDLNLTGDLIATDGLISGPIADFVELYKNSSEVATIAELDAAIAGASNPVLVVESNPVTIETGGFTDRFYVVPANTLSSDGDTLEFTSFISVPGANAIARFVDFAGARVITGASRTQGPKPASIEVRGTIVRTSSTTAFISTKIASFNNIENYSTNAVFDATITNHLAMIGNTSTANFTNNFFRVSRTAAP